MYLRSSGRRWPHHFFALYLMFTVCFVLDSQIELFAMIQTSDSITLFLKDVPLKDAIKSIESKSKIGFIYNSDEVNAKGHKVSLNVKDESVQKVISALFNNQPFIYKYDGNSVIITPKYERRLLSRIKTDRYSDTLGNSSVSGEIISNESGLPIGGATIKVKGTSIGAVSDDHGNFLIQGVSSQGAIIQVKFLGYEKREIQFSGISHLTIRLKRASNSLDEIVALGYGVTTRRYNTGNVVKMNAEQISTQPVSNPLAALEGRMPGVYVNQLTGVPGGAMNILVRGKSSISSGTNPLYLIDGVPFTSNSVGSSSFASSMTYGGNPMNSINPADIESIEVLKDADATAIYGSRGSNGVVLITTKKGKAGTTKVNVEAYTGIGRASNKIPLLSTPEYLQMRREAFTNDNTTPTTSIAPDLLLWDTTKNTDWQDQLIGGTAKSNDFQGSLSGGSNGTQFLIGGGYHKETSIFPGSFGDSRGSAYFNLSHTSTSQRFKAGMTASYSADINDLFYNDLTQVALYLPPDTPEFRDKSGNLLWPSFDLLGNGNPYAYQKQKYRSSSYNLLTALQMNYMILPFLQVKLNGGYTRMQVNQIHTFPLSSLNPDRGYTTDRAYSQFGNSSIETWIIEPQINFNKVTGKLTLDLLAGISFQQDVRQSRTMQGTGFSNEALMENLSASNSISIVQDNYSLYHYTAFFTRANFNFATKYILNLTARRDGSTRFGQGKQFGNFGAVGAAWIFSEEKLIKHSLPFLSFGKIRASYGATGNDNIGDYQYMSTWFPSRYPYNNIGGMAPSRIAVPDYSWEVTKKTDIGVSLGFFSDKILVSASYFNNRSGNQLLSYAIPPSVGFNSIFTNFPAVVENKGFEFEINTQNIAKSHFSWSSNINLTLPRNKLVSFPGLEKSSYSSQYELGQPITIIKTLKLVGVNQSTGFYQFATAKDGIPTSMPSYPDDLVTNSNIAQKLYGGFGNILKYKNWSLDVFFQFVEQTGYDYIYGNMPGTYYNQPAALLNHWQKPGDNSDTQRFSNSDVNALIPFIYYSNYSDKRVTDASFIRLKNLQISYSLNEAWLKKLHANKVNIYARGQNLWTITSYNGMDPEHSSNTFGSYTQPSLRILVGGIQITF